MKSCVIAYEGGGYDGCIWEPNFALYYYRKVYDVASSGSMGLFRNGLPNPQKFPLEKYVRSEGFKEQDPHFYPLTSGGMKAMFEKYRVDFCLRVVKKINKMALIPPHPHLQALCSDCREMVDPNNCILPDGCGRGDGGIGIIIDECLCSDCYEDGRCMNPKCGAYVGEDGLNPGGLCHWCYNSAREGLPEVTELEEAIERGRYQLAVMCRLRPKLKDRFNRQHAESVAVFNHEITVLMGKYFGVER